MFVVEEQSPSDCAGIFFIVFFIIIIILIISFGCWKYCNNEQFESIMNNISTDSGLLYNPLYTSPNIISPGSFIYTQPQGDTNAANYGKAIQGTSGSFLPLQGRAAGVFMKNSGNDNTALPSKDKGNIGGYPNYTDQVQTSRVTAGFNNFGAPFEMEKGPQLEDKDYSNSYLIDGANQRTCNSGQKCPNLPAQDWWPTIKKGNSGFATQASDAMVECEMDSPTGMGSKSIQECKGKGAERFLKSKYEPRWLSVFKKQ